MLTQECLIKNEKSVVGILGTGSVFLRSNLLLRGLCKKITDQLIDASQQFALMALFLTAIA